MQDPRQQTVASSSSARARSGAPLVRAAAIALVAAMPLSSLAAQQRLDSAYMRQVREHTTDERFLPATVASIPASETVPSPLRHFGTIAGAPGVMHRTDEIYGYFRALAQATPRVRVEKVATSEEGRDILLVIVADEQTMGRLDQYRQAVERLADPRRLSEQEVEQVIAGAKPIYYLNGGLHSPEMLPELVYRLAVSEDPAIRKIRDNVITIINPVSEPDGRDKQVDWYHRYTKGRAQFDDGFPRSTPYWGKYVVHDNNRDGIQISQALTKAIYDIYYRWHPLVMHDLHESVPLLYISTGTGPYNETNDPIAISEWQVLANHDVQTLSALGMPGVWTWGFFDGWWPGYAMWVATNHNSVGRFYETFGNAGADTYVRDLSTQRYAGELVTSRTWYRVWPPTRKVRWSARNNVNYMQAGVLASLGYAADNGQTLLRNFYRKGQNSITRGKTLKPHAYVVPGFDRQRDPKRTAYLVNQLRRHAIEVHEVAAGDSAGDFVVRLDQPYRDLAVNLLSRQNFPSSAQYPPYDDIAWTLGYIYGVEVKAVDDTSVFRRPNLRLLTDTVAARAQVAGTGTTWLLANKAQGEILPALYWLRSRAGRSAVRASAMQERYIAGRDTFPAGSILFENLDPATARELGERFALRLVAAPSPLTPRPAALHALDLPRVAIYHTWYDTQDEGWSRYTFEQYGVPYASIDKDDLRRGRLRSRFDVIVVPQTRGSIEQMLHEHDRKWGPLAYQKTKDTPSFGTPASTADMTGGMGFEGLAELQRFVEDGGTLITLGGSTRLAGETGLARQLSAREARTLFHPGSIVRARARQAASPVLYGYPETFTIFRGNGPLYQVPARDSALMVVQYGTRIAEAPRDTGDMLGMRGVAREGDQGIAMRDPGFESKRDQAVARKPNEPAQPTEPPSQTPGQRPAQNPAQAPAQNPAPTTAGATTAGTTVGGTNAPRQGAGQGAAQAGAEGRGGSDYVVSGMVRGQDEIIGQGAIFDIPVRNGRVIAFTFDPLHRFLNHHEFPLVWNAIMNWNDRPPAKAAEGERVAGQ